MLPFEKLEVYKKSFQANQQVYRFIKAYHSEPDSTIEQLGQASMNVMLKIAAASARFGEKDQARVYEEARASAVKCSVLLHLLWNEDEMPEDVYASLYICFDEIIHMLNKMIRNKIATN